MKSKRQRREKLGLVVQVQFAYWRKRESLKKYLRYMRFNGNCSLKFKYTHHLYS